MFHDPAVDSDGDAGVVSGLGVAASGDVRANAPNSHSRQDSFASAASESPASRRRRAGLGAPGQLASDFHSRFPKRHVTPPDPELTGPILDFHAARERRAAAEEAARSAAAAARKDQAARAAAASKLLGGPPVPAGTAGYQVYEPHTTRPIVANKVGRKHVSGVRYGDAALASGHTGNGNTGTGAAGQRGADADHTAAGGTTPSAGHKRQRARAVLQPIGGGDRKPRANRAHADAVQRALAATAPGGGVPVGKSLGDTLNLVDSRAMQRYVADTRRPRRRRGASLDKAAVAVRPGTLAAADGRDSTGAGAKLNLADPAREYNARRLERRAAAARARREVADLSPIAGAKGGAKGDASAAFTGVVVTVPKRLGGMSPVRTLSHVHTPVMPQFEPMVAASPTHRRKRRAQRRRSQASVTKDGASGTGAGAAASGGASGTGGTGGSGGAAELDVAGEEELTEEAQKARAALLAEWRGAFTQEAAHYDSISIEAEVRLQKANLFAEKLGNPNQLGTAVAFQVLDDVFSIFGRYKELMRSVKDLMLRAVYREDPEHLPDSLRHLFHVDAEEGRVSSSDERLRRYFACTPWFEHAKLLQEERDSLVHLTGQLRDALVRLEDEKGVKQNKDSAKFMALRWRSLIRQKKDRKTIDKLLLKVHETFQQKEETAVSPGKQVLEKVLALFSEVENEADRVRILKQLMGQSPQTWEEMLNFIVNHESLTASAASKMVINSLLRRRGMHLGTIREVVSEILNSPLVADYPDGRLQLLISTYDMAESDQAAFLAYVLDKLSPQRRDMCLQRLLFLEGAVSRTDQVRHTMSRIQNVTTADRLTLLQATMESMIEKPDELAQLMRMLQTQIGRLASTADPASAQMLLRALAAQLPPGCLCDIIKCEHHKHPTSDDEAVATEEVKVQVATTPKTPHRDKKVKMALPWSKYLRPPTRKVVKIMKLRNALSLIYEMWHKKIVTDAAEDRARDDTLAAAEGRIPSPRQHFGEFIEYFLLTKFGLPSLRDAYLYSIVDAVARYGKKSKRLELFAIMCGVARPEVYTSRISDVMLHLLKLLFPKFSPGVFRSRKEGLVFLELSAVLNAVTTVFIQEDVSFANDRLMLTDGRHEQLLAMVQRAAGTTAEHLARAAEGERRGSVDMVGLTMAKALAHKKKLAIHEEADQGSGAESGASGGAGGDAGAGGGERTGQVDLGDVGAAVEVQGSDSDDDGGSDDGDEKESERDLHARNRGSPAPATGSRVGSRLIAAASTRSMGASGVARPPPVVTARSPAAGDGHSFQSPGGSTPSSETASSRPPASTKSQRPAGSSPSPKARAAALRGASSVHSDSARRIRARVAAVQATAQPVQGTVSAAGGPKVAQQTARRRGAGGGGGGGKDGKPFGFGPNAVIVDVDTVMWLCLEMFIEQCDANKKRMEDMYYAFDEDSSGTLSLVEFHTLLQTCCPDRLTDRLIADLFAEVVTIDRQSREQDRREKARLRKKGVAVSDDEDEDDLEDAVSASAFAALCHKHGITPPNNETFDTGLSIVQSSLNVRARGIAKTQERSYRRLALANKGNGSGGGEDGGNSSDGTSGAGSGGDSDTADEDDPFDDPYANTRQRNRRSSLADRISALERARGSLNRMVYMLQGRGMVMRAADRFKNLLKRSPSVHLLREGPLTTAINETDPG